MTRDGRTPRPRRVDVDRMRRHARAHAAFAVPVTPSEFLDAIGARAHGRAYGGTIPDPPTTVPGARGFLDSEPRAPRPGFAPGGLVSGPGPHMVRPWEVHPTIPLAGGDAVRDALRRAAAWTTTEDTTDDVTCETPGHVRHPHPVPPSGCLRARSAASALARIGELRAHPRRPGMLGWVAGEYPMADPSIPVPILPDESAWLSKWQMRARIRSDGELGPQSWAALQLGDFDVLAEI